MHLGFDIGYSNLKLSAMKGGDLHTQVLPAGAAPTDRLPESVGNDPADESGFCVLVGDTLYAAGVPQSRFQHWNRSLHEDYPATDSYRALFHAGLLSLGANEVDVLVTGLPVRQYLDETRRQALADQLTGTHQVTRKRSITVKTVKVVPQPVGAYMDLLFTFDDPNLLADSRILVIDPGFFSVDWVVIDGGGLHQAVSGTSSMATSMILETMQPLLRDDHGGNVSLAKLEQAVRTGKDTVVICGEPVVLAPYLETAVAAVVPVALDALRQSIRSSDNSVDIVLVAGGAAALYEPSIREAFPNSRIVIPHDPVLANVRGFGRMAARG